MSKKSFKENPALQFIGAAANEQKKSEQKPLDLQESSDQGELIKNDNSTPKGYCPKLPAETRSRKLAILLQPSLYEKIQTTAKTHGVSVNEVIHSVLEGSMGEKGNAPKR